MPLLTSSSSLILIADDCDARRGKLCAVLKQDGYQIIEAQNSEQCINLVVEYQPRLVLLNINFSDIEGVSCCTTIKNLPQGDRIPVILMLESQNSALIDQIFRLGASDYSSIPIQFSELRSRVQHVLKAFHSDHALEESERHYRLVLDIFKEVIFHTDLSGQFTFLNSSWMGMTGFSPVQTLGKSIINFIYPEDRTQFIAKFKPLIQGKRFECRTQVRYFTQSGRLGWMEFYGQLFKRADGSPSHIIGSLHNITERQGHAQRLNVEQATTAVLAESATESEAIPQLLRTICHSLDWDYGEYWVIDLQSNQLHCAESWRTPIPSHLKKYLTEPQFALAAEFIHEIWEHSSPASLNNIQPRDRTSTASQASMNAAFSLPILGGYERLGVMVFFKREPEVANTKLLKQMASVGSRVGEFLMRKRAESEVRRQHTILQSELNQAAEYVRSLLPMPLTTPVSIQHHFIPSNQLGGDAFDYYWLDDEHLAFYLLDVAGHGVRSTLLSVSVLNVLRSQSILNTDFYQPASVLTGLNRIFQMNDQGDDYFTIWYGVLNCKTQALTYASAGHPPALLMVNDSVQRLASGGPPIGLMPHLDFNQETLDIYPDQTLYLYSDGVYEILQANGEIWGLDALIHTLISKRPEFIQNVELIHQEIQSIHGNVTFDDDYSLLQIGFDAFVEISNHE